MGSSHRRILPVAALMGAVLLMLSDLAARMLLRPQEIPIGIITALVGAPFLLASPMAPCYDPRARAPCRWPERSPSK